MESCGRETYGVFHDSEVANAVAIDLTDDLSVSHGKTAETVAAILTLLDEKDTALKKSEIHDELPVDVSIHTVGRWVNQLHDTDLLTATLTQADAGRRSIVKTYRTTEQGRAILQRLVQCTACGMVRERGDTPCEHGFDDVIPATSTDGDAPPLVRNTVRPMAETGVDEYDALPDRVGWVPVQAQRWGIALDDWVGVVKTGFREADFQPRVVATLVFSVVGFSTLGLGIIAYLMGDVNLLVPAVGGLLFVQAMIAGVEREDRSTETETVTDTDSDSSETDADGEREVNGHGVGRNY